MASSSVSCASQNSCSDLYLSCDFKITEHKNCQHEAVMDIVASAQLLTESGSLSISETGAAHRDTRSFAQSAARTVKNAKCPVVYESPLEQQKLLPKKLQTAASWQSMWHAKEQQKQHANSRAPARRLCLDVSNTCSAAESAPENPAAVLPPFTPAPTAAAAESRSRRKHSSNRSRLDQWLDSMELRLQIPATSVMPSPSPCPAPKGVTAADSKKRPSATEAAESLLAEFEKTSKRSNMVLHEQRQSAAEFACAAVSAAAAAAAASEQAIPEACSRSSAAAEIAAAVGEPQDHQGEFSKRGNNRFGGLPPPAFVILGVLSRQAPQQCAW